MGTIIMMQGIQGSGKSTWAKNWVSEKPQNRVRFNNDDMRYMMGPYTMFSREPLLRELKKQFLIASMERGYDIVMDNMNLNPKELKFIENIIETGKYDYQIKFQKMDTDLETCIKRDSEREHPIGEDAIRKTYSRYFNN